MSDRTKHILFIDESGNHDLGNIDAKWPIFVLVGLLVGESYYAKTLARRVRELKLSNDLSANTVLHSRDIRRRERSFAFLRDAGARERLYEALNDVFSKSRIRIFAVIIDKARLAGRWIFPPNPYDASLSQLLSLVCGPPGSPTAWRPNVVRISAERRGEERSRIAIYKLSISDSGSLACRATERAGFSRDARSRSGGCSQLESTLYQNRAPWRDWN